MSFRRFGGPCAWHCRATLRTRILFFVLKARLGFAICLFVVSAGLVLGVAVQRFALGPFFVLKARLGFAVCLFVDSAGLVLGIAGQRFALGSFFLF
jgi:hypothetical protein